MRMLNGYFDGVNIVVDENTALRKGQRVRIVIPDENATAEHKMKLLETYYGACEGLFQGIDAQHYVDRLRENDRV